MVKGTAKMKISSKREGEESEVDGYNASVSFQSDELSKDVELHSCEGSNESAQISQQTTQKSSELGSNQQQNQPYQIGTKPTINDDGSGNKEGKPTYTTTNSSLSAQTQVITGSQPKSNSSCGPSSSHDSQSVNQGAVNHNQKLEDNLSASGGSTSKQHLETTISNSEVNKTSVCTPNVPVSTSKGKSNSSTIPHQTPSETAGTK